MTDPTGTNDAMPSQELENLTPGGSNAATAPGVDEPEPTPEVSAKMPEFAELGEASSGGTPANDLSLLYDVNVEVTAELGRRMIALGELLNLGTGAVVEFDRTVSEPVDLMAQGIRVARGEVVVVDDRFAIRIKEIEAPKKTGK